MKARREPLQLATLHRDDHGTPSSPMYGDVYHARSGAIEQARSVFLRGNGLPERWHGQPSFTVCETGFGLGNNFLALWQLWRRSPGAPQRLHVLSFEAHPFTREDLGRALAHHEGELREMADALLQSWPPLLPGLHRLEFEGGRLTLTLGFGKVEYLSRQVEASVDAFFLDGFSPRSNPAMWSRELFGQLVRIANRGATAATWCCAGQVRRDLADAGFLVTREPGFGGKRHMSRAVLRPTLGRHRESAPPGEVIVVGGGFAGAGIARSLAVRGYSVSVYDPALGRGPAGTHEGHLCAAMTPALSRDDNPMARLSRAGVLLAELRWRAFPEAWETCGSLLQVSPDEEDAWKRSLGAWSYPEDWAVWRDAAEASQLCGTPLPRGGIWLPHGAKVRPARLVQSLLAHDAIRPEGRAVAGLRRGPRGWQALCEEGRVMHEAPVAVLATGGDTSDMLQAAMPDTNFGKLAALQRMGGQVGYFRAGGPPRTRAIVAGNGYWLPEDAGIHVGGSTYKFDTGLSAPSEQGFIEVSRKVAALLDIDADILLKSRAVPDGWAGWRAAVSDHLPLIGPATPDSSLWVACAYGSRGLSWMTLAGEILATTLAGEPLPVERDLLRTLRVR